MSFQEQTNDISAVQLAVDMVLWIRPPNAACFRVQKLSPVGADDGKVSRAAFQSAGFCPIVLLPLVTLSRSHSEL